MVKYFPLGRIIHYSISFDHKLKHISHVKYNLTRDQIISSPQCGVYTEYTHGKSFIFGSTGRYMQVFHIIVVGIYFKPQFLYATECTFKTNVINHQNYYGNKKSTKNAYALALKFLSQHYKFSKEITMHTLVHTTQTKYENCSYNSPVNQGENIFQNITWVASPQCSQGWAH